MASIYNRGTKAAPNWWGKYKDENGKWKSVPTGQANKEAAKAFISAAVARVANGKVGIIERTAEQKARAMVTVRQLFDRFMAEYSPPKIKDIESYREQTRTVFNARILERIGHRAAASITLADVERMRDELSSEEYAPGSVQWTLARLSKLYTWGNKVGAIDCGNPTTGCDRPSAPPTLDFLSREEVASLLAHAEEHAVDVFPMVATAIYCGLRKGELYGLRWTDVSLDAKRLDVNRSYTKLPKSGKARHLPMHPELVRILRGWKERYPKTDDGLVFPVRDRWGKYRMGGTEDMQGLEEVLRAARCHVPKKPWHALRHTFASHFMMAGGNILTLQKLLGHAKLDMTLIYAHLAPDFMAAEVARMSFAMPKAGVADLGEERRKKEQLGTPVVQEANAEAATA